MSMECIPQAPFLIPTTELSCLLRCRHKHYSDGVCLSVISASRDQTLALPPRCNFDLVTSVKPPAMKVLQRPLNIRVA